MFGISVVSIRSFVVAVIAASAIVLTVPALASDVGMEAEGMGHHKMEATVFGKPGDPKKVSRTVTIEATEIAFNVHELKFKKGETVRFIFTNKGEQPHEFMIAEAAEQAEHRKMMTAMAGMDMSKMHHNDGNTVSTEPGETKELVWTFTKAGTAEFSCNYPGHAEVGMQGKIAVN